MNCRKNLASKFNMMSEIQRDFLLSKIIENKPENIIEIGVYAGGATYFMYEATRENSAKILSVDINYYSNYHVPTGFVMEGVEDSRLRREFGKDVSEVCNLFDKTGEKFDFLILDTAHLHPIESLNFITILPYLTENATVVLHDIALFVWQEKSLACKLLFDTVTGEKCEAIEDPNYYFANIGAFKVNSDTRKNIRDVFSMLRFPWEMFPIRFGQIWDVVKLYYNDECIKLFKSAFIYNAWKLSQVRGENLLLKFFLNADAIKNKLMDYDKIIFWGFGSNTFYRELVILFKMMNLPMPYEFWDKKWEAYQNGASVLKPKKPTPESLNVNDCVIATGKIELTNHSILSNIIKSDCHNFFTLKDLINI